MKKFITLLSAYSVLTALSCAARADEPNELPELNLNTEASSTLINITRIEPGNKVSKLAWSSKLVAFPDGKPELQVTINVPQRGVELKTPPDATWNPKTGELVLRMTRPEARVVRPTDTIVVTLEPKSPLVYVSSGCRSAGLRFRRTEKSKFSPLFLHLDCKAGDKGNVEVTVSYPENRVKFLTGQGTADLTTSGSSAKFTVSTAIAAEVAPGERKIAEFKLQGEKGEAGFAIGFEKVQKRWSLDAGLGLTYLSYDEPTQPVSISMISLTGKIGALYQLVPDKWDLVMSAYSTLIPIPVARDPKSTPASWFSGGNLRVGYRFPESTTLLHSRVRVYGGWYAWTMTGQSVYGVSLLSGPQFFMVLDQPTWKNGNSSFTYLKYSPIAASISSLKLSNFELAIGGGYNFKWRERPLIATLDIARIGAESSNGQNKFSMFSVSAGLSVPFKL